MGDEKGSTPNDLSSNKNHAVRALEETDNLTKVTSSRFIENQDVLCANELFERARKKLRRISAQERRNQSIDGNSSACIPPTVINEEPTSLKCKGYYTKISSPADQERLSIDNENKSGKLNALKQEIHNDDEIEDTDLDIDEDPEILIVSKI